MLGEAPAIVDCLSRRFNIQPIAFFLKKIFGYNENILYLQKICWIMKGRWCRKQQLNSYSKTL